ncbi:MAG: Nif3-like dinuclear metal center hexameric protein [Deferribacteraceae bacterium]|nr:Nif3-like dinuclear metal center hexameric protein [Deferribacteraceae bacterium]
MTSVDKIISFVENDFADVSRQLSWDFSGKQVYLGDVAVSRICLALDPLLLALEQAHKWGCELLITHHPLFFKPLRGLFHGRDSAAVYAVKSGITILSYHTNLDLAENGLNAYILELLGARNIAPLAQEKGDNWYKLTVFTPSGYEEALLDALSATGAGNIGNYSRCAFYSEGIGTFTPNQDANPFIGERGRAEKVKELRLEMIVPEKRLFQSVQAMRKVHPYEEPAFDIIPIKSPEKFGLGLVGEFDEPIPFESFIELLREKLSVADLRANMYRTEEVKRFSVSTGSGAELWQDAAKVGVDVHITGDLKHHTALDARQSGVTIVDVGHFYSERIYLTRFAEVLKREFNVEVFLAEETPPIITLA